MVCVPTLPVLPKTVTERTAAELDGGDWKDDG
jgi:hypothetical protein